jgi:hypothetical protein
MIRPTAALSAALIAVCAWGCGDGRPPGRTLDESLAKQALTRALEGWKAGRPHAEPSESDPDLKVADEDWLAGRALLDFEILPGEEPIGAALACPVLLSMEGPRGGKAEHRVTYLVSTDPSPSVIRRD